MKNIIDIDDIVLCLRNFIPLKLKNCSQALTTARIWIGDLEWDFQGTAHLTAGRNERYHVAMVVVATR